MMRLGHVGISVQNFNASKAFYDAALAPLGIAPRMVVLPERFSSHAGVGYGSAEELFFFLYEGLLQGDGLHIAFAAPNQPSVDAFYAAALQNGGKDNGQPGIREKYHPTYYAGFVLDPDMINVEAFYFPRLSV